MTTWVAVSREQHGRMGYRPPPDYGFAAFDAVAEVGVAELSQLLPHYVLGVARVGEQWQLVAVLGLQPRQNLYARSDGSWIARYVPAALRRHPFRLARAPDRDDLVLCIAEDALTTDPAADALFGEETLSEETRTRMAFVQEVEKNLTVTRQALQQLDDAGALTPWPVRIPLAEGQAPLEARGLYRIDEPTLNGLEAETYASLRGAPLAIAHAHFFSQAKLPMLAALARQQWENGDEADDSLASLFGDTDEDDLTFDFS